MIYMIYLSNRSVAEPNHHYDHNHHCNHYPIDVENGKTRRTIYGLLKDFVSLLLNGTELILHGENGLTRLGLKLVPN